VSLLLPAVEVETGPQPRAAVVWMHGLGADGHDFEGVVPELALPPLHPVRFVFPHAPRRPMTIAMGQVMRAWYDVRNDAGERREDEAGVRTSQRAIEALVERERQRGVPPHRVVLAGFSQGGAMAFQVGLRYPERLAGVLALSCFLPLAHTLATEAAAANRDIPIFMAHGTDDPLIPVARARRSRDVLAALGYRVEWHEYAIPHAVSAEEVRDAGGWLCQALGLAS